MNEKRNHSTKNVKFSWVNVYCITQFGQNTFAVTKLIHKDWPIKKMTTYEFGYFITIFGHFFANYIYISHKTEVLMVILMG